MKNSIFRIETRLLGIALFLITVTGYSQDNKKLTREQKKEARTEQQNYDFLVVDSLIRNRSFVVEADFLENEYGNIRPVSSNLNFIMLDSTRAVLQTGSNARAGYNGLGGVTAEGNISGLKITRNEKNKSFYIRFSVTSDIGIYDVVINVNSNKNARATISGLSRGKLVYNGHIQEIAQSGAYKGRNYIY